MNVLNIINIFMVLSHVTSEKLGSERSFCYLHKDSNLPSSPGALFRATFESGTNRSVGNQLSPVMGASYFQTHPPSALGYHRSLSPDRPDQIIVASGTKLLRCDVSLVSTDTSSGNWATINITLSGSVRGLHVDNAFEIVFANVGSEVEAYWLKDFNFNVYEVIFKPGPPTITAITSYYREGLFIAATNGSSSSITFYRYKPHDTYFQRLDLYLMFESSPEKRKQQYHLVTDASHIFALAVTGVYEPGRPYKTAVYMVDNLQRLQKCVILYGSGPCSGGLQYLGQANSQAFSTLHVLWGDNLLFYAGTDSLYLAAEDRPSDAHRKLLTDSDRPEDKSTFLVPREVTMDITFSDERVACESDPSVIKAYSAKLSCQLNVDMSYVQEIVWLQDFYHIYGAFQGADGWIPGDHRGFTRGAGGKTLLMNNTGSASVITFTPRRTTFEAEGRSLWRCLTVVDDIPRYTDFQFPVQSQILQERKRDPCPLPSTTKRSTIATTLAITTTARPTTTTTTTTTTTETTTARITSTKQTTTTQTMTTSGQPTPATQLPPTAPTATAPHVSTETSSQNSLDENITDVISGVTTHASNASNTGSEITDDTDVPGILEDSGTSPATHSQSGEAGGDITGTEGGGSDPNPTTTKKDIVAADPAADPGFNAETDDNGVVAALGVVIVVVFIVLALVVGIWYTMKKRAHKRKEGLRNQHVHQRDDKTLKTQDDVHEDALSKKTKISQDDVTSVTGKSIVTKKSNTSQADVTSVTGGSVIEETYI